MLLLIISEGVSLIINYLNNRFIENFPIDYYVGLCESIIDERLTTKVTIYFMESYFCEQLFRLSKFFVING